MPLRRFNPLYPPPVIKQFLPQNSGLHRQAVFAVYRAILSQCNAIALDDTDKDALKQITRNRFHANRTLRVPRRLHLAFTAAYKALDHLDDAVAGETAAIERVSDFLARAPAHLKQAPPIPPAPPKHNAPAYEYPEEHKFLNVFPRETVEGERKVPFFVRANGFPMLRWKKPQPYKLTRTLTGLIKSKQKNMDYQLDYEEVYIPMGENEDVWERIVARQLGKGEDGGSFAQDAREGAKVIKDISRERFKKVMDKAHPMVAIVEREQELKHKEDAEREAAKRSSVEQAA